MVFDKDNWQEIFATIQKNKLRTAMTAFGVFWGIFMLVIMLGSGSGLRNGILKEFAGSSTNSFFLWAQRTNKAYKGMKPGRTYNFNNADTQTLEQIPELAVVSPQNQLGGYDAENNVVRGLKTGAFSVMGEYPNIAQIQNIKINNGRFINQNDIKEKRKVCVIGARVKEVLFSVTENPINDYIRVNGVFFKVIGVAIPQGSGQQYQEQASKIHIPFSTFQNTFNYGDVVGWYSISSQPNCPASVAEEKAMAILKERHKIAPDDIQAVGHWNTEVQYEKMTGLFQGIEWLIWIVGSGTLIAGVIGVSNIMLIVVKERTKEIGVKRAIGATPFSIMSQIIMEALFLTSIAGYLGLVSGIALIELIDSLVPATEGSMFINPRVSLHVASWSLLILILSGALAGFIPARKAVSINPVEALRIDN